MHGTTNIKKHIILFVCLFCVILQGHSPAGGCLLALSCEYRVMVGPKYTIGLNETQLGIVAPKW
jgi:enoyl-CoA hydratase/carnithine racemase